MATPSKTADEILKSYVANKRQRGVFTDPAFDKYAPKPEPVNPVIINQTATLAGPTNPTPVSDIEKIAKPVLGSWLKGKAGYAKILKTGALDTDTHGGNTVNGYWNTARKFDDPTLPLEERITKMIYGVETSGNPDAWRTINNYGYMGRAQMGKAFMSDYGIDPTMYMKDPDYQHKVTVNAVKKRIGELKGVYFRQGGKIVSGDKPYHGNSKKEDLLIVNPKDGSIYGAMRYDEIVFSQKDSNKIESLIEKGDTAKLGEFVASARAKQNDFVPLFAGGGKLMRIPNGYFVDSDGRVYQKIKNDLYRVGRIEDKKVKLMSEVKVNASEFEIPKESDPSSILDALYELDPRIAKSGTKKDAPIANIDATDSRGNKYTKNPDGTYLRLGEKKNYTYDPKSKKFNRIEEIKQALTTTPSRGSLPSGGKVGDTTTQGSAKDQPFYESNSIKVTQEYLNNFLAYNSAKQKGYTVGENGNIYDQDGKRVPIDKINSEAKNEQIDVDGKFGPETERAIKIYNTANPDKQIKYRVIDGVGYLESEGYLSKKPDYLQKYYETGKVPIYSGIDDVKPLEGKKDLVGMGKAASPIVPSSAAAQPKPAQGKVTPESVKNLLSAENLQRVGANVGDMAKMAALYRETGKPLPIYEQTEDWKKYTAMVENNATQGLNAAVQSQFNRDLNTNRALGYGQVVAASGGGGTQGAVLGALGNINQASANAIGQFAVADQAQRDKNLSQFGQVARANEQVNLSMYSQELQNAQNARMQATSLIPQIKSQIEGRNDMYNAYGPGSSYQKLIQSQLEKQQAETEAIKRSNSNVSGIFSEPSVNGTTDLISTADKSMIEQQKARYGIKPVTTTTNPTTGYVDFNQPVIFKDGKYVRKQ